MWCGLSSGSRDQICGSPAILLLSCPLPLGQGQRSIGWLPAVRVLSWFADCFSVLQHCLTVDVAHLLRRWALWLYFRQWLITHPLLALVPFQSLFTESSCEDRLLALPLSPVHLEHPVLLLCVLFQFLVYSVFFLWGRGCQSVQRAMLVYPRGGCGNTACCLFAHLLVCWLSPKQV
jgi:hypothetical protein